MSETEILVKDVEEEEGTRLHCQYYVSQYLATEKRELTFSKKGHGGPT